MCLWDEQYACVVPVYEVSRIVSVDAKAFRREHESMRGSGRRRGAGQSSADAMFHSFRLSTLTGRSTCSTSTYFGASAKAPLERCVLRFASCASRVACCALRDACPTLFSVHVMGTYSQAA